MPANFLKSPEISTYVYTIYYFAVPPVFTTPVSNEFTCEDVTIHWQCLVGLGDSGSLSCAVMSNPTMATISVNTSDISDQNNLVVGDTTITIAGFTSGHSGFYICTASNDIGVTTRVIRLLLQGIIYIIIVFAHGTVTNDDQRPCVTIKGLAGPTGPN